MLRSGKVEAEWGDAVQERRKMRKELTNLIRWKFFIFGLKSDDSNLIQEGAHCQWETEHAGDYFICYS